MSKLYQDAQAIIKASLLSASPDRSVIQALKDYSFWGKGLYEEGKIVLIAIGKAAWQMAFAAFSAKEFGKRNLSGVVITKYGHSMSDIPEVTIFEAGHPIPDSNSFVATEAAINAVSGLSPNDRVLFLISGGGSALFEKPLVTTHELESITSQLLACGADIVEINIIRKRLSAVKGGRFAQICAPAKVYSIVLSDIIGDKLDMIASGPAQPDSSTCQDAIDIIKKYNIKLKTREWLTNETPKKLDNVTTIVSGNVRQLCFAARDKCLELGYTPHILTDSLNCTARDAGAFLSSIARFYSNTSNPIAFIAGGETVVKLIGNGKGGRNQEIALSAAIGIDGLQDVVIFSFGSDGTDGPTDAAGGIVNGNTYKELCKKGINAYDFLENNDAYHALQAVDSLIVTGPTGTNVNDLSVVLIH